MRRLLSIGLALAAITATTAVICAAPPRPSAAHVPGAPVADAVRPLVRMLEGDRPVEIPAGVKATITLGADGAVSGFSGVNSFGGKYEVRAGHIQWTSAFFSTRKGGSPAAMEFERRFMEILSACTKIEESDQTVLTGSAGQLIFGAPAVQK